MTTRRNLIAGAAALGALSVLPKVEAAPEPITGTDAYISIPALSPESTITWEQIETGGFTLPPGGECLELAAELDVIENSQYAEGYAVWEVAIANHQHTGKTLQVVERVMREASGHRFVIVYDTSEDPYLYARLYSYLPLTHDDIVKAEGTLRTFNDDLIKLKRGRYGLEVLFADPEWAPNLETAEEHFLGTFDYTKLEGPWGDNGLL